MMTTNATNIRDPHVNQHSVSLTRMAKATPDPDRAQGVERLTAFLRYAETKLGLNRSALARKLGMHKSTISNALVRGVSGDLKLALQRVLGLEQRYWDSPTQLDPAACVVRRTDAGHLQRIVEIAKAEGESKIVLGELASLDPPNDADPWWWFEQYLRITREVHKRHTKAAG